MTFFKFLSFAFLSLLFWGNLQAECVDLSGVYECAMNGRTEKVNVSRSIDRQEVTYILDGQIFVVGGTANPTGVTKVTCDENRFQVYGPIMNNGTDFDRAEFDLVNQGSTLRFRIIVSDKEFVMVEFFCNRIQ